METMQLFKRYKHLMIAAAAATATKILIQIYTFYFLLLPTSERDTSWYTKKFISGEFGLIINMVLFFLLAYMVISGVEYFCRRYCNENVTQSEIWGHLCVTRKRTTFAWILLISSIVIYFVLSTIPKTSKTLGSNIGLLNIILCIQSLMWDVIPLIGTTAALQGIKKSILQKQIAVVDSEPRPLARLFVKILLAATAVGFIAVTMLHINSVKFSTVISSSLPFEEKQNIAASLMAVSRAVSIIHLTAVAVILICGFFLLNRVFTEQRQLSIEQAVKAAGRSKSVCWAVCAVYFVLASFSNFQQLQIGIAFSKQQNGLAQHLIMQKQYFSFPIAYLGLIIPLLLLWWVCAVIWKKQTQQADEL